MKKGKVCKYKGCDAPPMKGLDYCFFHNPEKAKERKIAQIKGGKRGQRAVLLESAVRIEKVDDVIALLGESINQVRIGEVDPKVASVVGYLANTMLRALELRDGKGQIDESIRWLVAMSPQQREEKRKELEKKGGYIGED
ncbi:MAG: hypothetical protein V2A53_07680 [bacterium]